MSRQRHETRDCSWQPVNKHVTASNTRHQVHLETHSRSFLTRSQTAADVFCDSALSSSITANISKTTAQVNIALTKFETAQQVSVSMSLGFMGRRCQKAANLIFGLILKPVCLHVTLSVCLSHCTSLPACLSVSLLYIFLSVCVFLSFCLSAWLFGSVSQLVCL